MRDRREIETLLLTIYSGLPLYAAESGLRITVLICHAALGLLLGAAILQRSVRVPRTLLQSAAVCYLLFMPFDAMVLSRSLIGASTNLVFFIAVYLAIDPESRVRRGQRLLIALLICITSLATSTSLFVVLFALGFALLMFRQMIDLSREGALQDVGRAERSELPARVAWGYLLPTALLAIAMFPALPRIHNPLVKGIATALPNSTTGLSESINFAEERNISQDGSVVARVWMPQDAIAFFTPLRMRGAVYDEYRGGRWRGSGRSSDYRPVRGSDGVYVIARPVGLSRTVRVQQNMMRDNRLLLPEGTHLVRGTPRLFEIGQRSTYVVPQVSTSLTFEAELSRKTQPLAVREAHIVRYPLTPEIQALADRLAGNATTPADIAGRFEQYLSENFQYVPNPAQLGRTFTVDDFLLRERRGHCEYFAAGMVVLLEAKGIPARIVGGFYGGKLNPLSGYFTVQRSDAHAWVEVYDGGRWVVYDPTPAQLRPGNQQEGLIRTYATALADWLTYFWDRYVLTFGLGDQIALFVRVISNAGDLLRNSKAGLVAAGRAVFSLRGFAVLCVTAAVMLAATQLRRRRRSPYLQMLEELQRMGVSVDSATAPGEIVERVERLRPELLDEVRRIVELHERERFSPRPPSDGERKSARAALQQLFAKA